MASERILDIISFLCVMLIGIWTCSIKEERENRKGLALLKAGMLLTVAADFCLLILNRALAGVVIFCCVQTIYAVRYDKKRARSTLLWIGLVAGCTAVVFLCVDRFMQAGTLYAVASIYSICLGTAVGRAVLFYRKKEYSTQVRRLILAGMILFLLCDINVALYHLLPTHMIFMWMGEPIAWARLCGRLIWVFYLPSLLCLSLSGRPFSVSRYHEPI